MEYRFGIFARYPQHVVLLYSLRLEGKTRHEYIKVKPRGFWFHDQYFNNLERLISFFKNNQSNVEY